MKIIACCAVVGLHSLNVNASTVEYLLYYMCGFAVPVFMVCSGYLLFTKNEISMHYVIRKIVGLVRIVFIWSFVFATMKLGVHILSDDVMMFDFRSIFVGAFIQKGMLWQCWYLGALIMVYFFIKLINKKKSKLPLLWMICVSLGLILQILSLVKGVPVQKNVIQTFRLWTWFQYVLLGGLIQKNEFIGKNRSRNKYFKISIFVILSSGVCIYQYFIGTRIYKMPSVEFFYDSLIVIFWVYYFTKTILNIQLAENILFYIRILGKCTFAVYLIHPLIIQAWNTVFQLDFNGSSIITWVCVSLVSFFCSMILNKYKTFAFLIKV